MNASLTVAIDGSTIDNEVGDEKEGAIIESVVHDFAELMPNKSTARALKDDDVMMEVTVEQKDSNEELLQFTTKDIREKNPKLLDYIKVRLASTPSLE